MKWLVTLLFAGLLFAQCAQDGVFQRLEVINGSGSGMYELGQTVLVEADSAPVNTAFFAWEGDVDHLDEPMAPVASVKMPLADVRIEATYKDLPRYRLTVLNGSGSGEYLENTVVRIEADPAEEDFTFDRWVGDSMYVGRTDTAVTQVTIPSEPVTLEATYREAIELISFSNTVLPIILTKCSYPGCHDQDYRDLPLTTYAEIAPEVGPIQESIISGRMPSTGSLTADEREAIFLWIEQGVLNN